MFVGWDWASATHDVTVLDDAGAVVDRWAFRHSEQDLAAALDRLAGLSEPAALPVIIERTSGLVVDRLLAAGHPVVPVHPTAFWAARPRWGASGAKSDAGDSYKLADYLRTDGHRLRRLDRSDPGLQELESRIATRVASHPRAKLLASLPGVGTINLAQLLAEVGPILDRVSSAEHAAAECGAAPVTKASGKTSGVYFRWAANRRARKTLTAFAHNSRLASPWAGRLYADARARARRNPHATRIVARAWLRVIWACWQQATPYNPALHTTALRAAVLPT